MTATPSHWATPYIGRPWSAGDHCLDLARRIWREQCGWDVAVLPAGLDDPRGIRRAFKTASKDDWEQVHFPHEFDAVLMAQGLHPCHIGVWAAPVGQEAGIVHSMEGMATVFTPPARLPLLGLSLTGFWRRA